MLILHRKRHEVLCIGDAIRVVVLESDSGGARLGIEAPAGVTILREEIGHQIAEENRRASRYVGESPHPLRPGAPPVTGSDRESSE